MCFPDVSSTCGLVNGRDGFLCFLSLRGRVGPKHATPSLVRMFKALQSTNASEENYVSPPDH